MGNWKKGVGDKWYGEFTILEVRKGLDSWTNKLVYKLTANGTVLSSYYKKNDAIENARRYMRTH